MDNYDDYGLDAEDQATLANLLGDQPVEADEYADEPGDRDATVRAELAKLRKELDRMAAKDALDNSPQVQNGQPFNGPAQVDYSVNPDSLFGLSPIEANAKFSAKDVAETDELGNKRTPESRWAEAWNRATGGQQQRSHGGA